MLFRSHELLPRGLVGKGCLRFPDRTKQRLAVVVRELEAGTPGGLSIPWLDGVVQSPVARTIGTVPYFRL